MKCLIDYIVYRLYNIYLHKDPDPLASATAFTIIVVSSFYVFLGALILRIFFNVSVREINPDAPHLSVLIYVFFVFAIFYWRIKKKYTEIYITKNLTPRFEKSKYNKKIKGWMLIVLIPIWFLAFMILASIIS
ncbi:hypothetical protein HQ50_05785 [Porphyromonas sp. COT-052 OH4946]|uniref:hypothetical protein n=1 Tax=Porphyromonas sp. COT-052 OH4946 TaxID=1515618 RepID=UPI00051E1293|nr:hypothetical protein [Porphyromonas sp. COT-052 OH4946]KGL55336.1 hypothetical protein HQ50_05785 [Porphyromonas sp. COT-052 OH4946]